MFHVELAPLGGIFGPLKSDLGVFWPFRATDFIMGILKIWDNFLGPNGPILKFTFLESLRNLWLFGINKKDGCFFRFRTPSRHMWPPLKSQICQFWGTTALLIPVKWAPKSSGERYPGFLIEWIFYWIESSQIKNFE